MAFKKEKLITIMPDRCKDLHVYKWTNADKSLDKVAKVYGLKGGKDIWVKPPNEDIIKLRKKPESLKPGDKFFIPIPPNIVKKLRAEAEKYNKTKRAYVGWINVQEGKITQLEKNIEKLYTQVDKLTRKQFDGSDKKKAINQLIALLDPVASLLEPVAKLEVPFGTLRPVIKLQAFVGDLKKERVFMKGGNLEKVNLEKFKIKINNARTEIASLRKEISRLENELDQIGAETIQTWCRLRSVSIFATLQLKHFLR
jgi:outer membrane murein-binding lipoprotein Lpp